MNSETLLDIFNELGSFKFEILQECKTSTFLISQTYETIIFEVIKAALYDPNHPHDEQPGVNIKNIYNCPVYEVRGVGYVELRHALKLLQPYLIGSSSLFVICYSEHTYAFVDNHGETHFWRYDFKQSQLSYRVTYEDGSVDCKYYKLNIFYNFLI
jgi:hypothetical protein